MRAGIRHFLHMGGAESMAVDELVPIKLKCEQVLSDKNVPSAKTEIRCHPSGNMSAKTVSSTVVDLSTPKAALPHKSSLPTIFLQTRGFTPTTCLSSLWSARRKVATA